MKELVFLTFAGCAVTWGLCLWDADDSSYRADSDVAFRPQGPFPGRDVLGRIGECLEIVIGHLGLALRLLPALVLLIAAGLTAGLARREGLRGTAQFASPLRAWLGKRTAIVGLTSVLIFALTPVLLPWWILSVGGVVAASGTCVYVSNLPLKL